MPDLKSKDTVLEVGTILFKGCIGEEFKMSSPKPDDWDGCYLAFTKEHAKGYVPYDPTEKDTIRKIWSVRVKKALTVKEFDDPYLSGRASGAEKAKCVKTALSVPEAKTLSSWLAENNLAYKGPDSSIEFMELIVPWQIFSDYFDVFGSETLENRF